MQDTDTIANSVVAAVKDYAAGTLQTEDDYLAVRSILDGGVINRLKLNYESLGAIVVNEPLSFTQKYHQQIAFTLWFVFGGAAFFMVALWRQQKISVELTYKARALTALQVQLREANEHLHELATIDRLTSVLNRHAAEPMLDQVISRSLRSSEVFTLMIIDVDSFKNINDTLGHPTGDAVLKAIAGTLQSRLRGEDILARWGGDEFLIVAQCDDMVSCRLADDLIDAINGAADSLFGATISMGVAKIDPEEGWLHAYKRADNALLKAKDNGKNTIVRA
ncbi:GGDEF domain-containing protein [Salinibius halmophilus]|uniref:GGDEF domain-containing protein n=1 Tax=Salinibius halmophilus TaxID=1853216 RepID=UPI000E6668A2|nr:GGDEF domain-containing protein [Salinibius halmophilus]